MYKLMRFASQPVHWENTWTQGFYFLYKPEEKKYISVSGPQGCSRQCRSIFNSKASFTDQTCKKSKQSSTGIFRIEISPKKCVNKNCNILRQIQVVIVKTTKNINIFICFCLLFIVNTKWRISPMEEIRNITKGPSVCQCKAKTKTLIWTLNTQPIWV